MNDENKETEVEIIVSESKDFSIRNFSDYVDWIMSCGGCLEFGKATSHKHCVLCWKAFPTPSKQKRHFMQGHFRHAVPYEGQLCLPCKRSHNGTNSYLSSKQRAHFHCPICFVTLVQAQQFRKHLSTHKTTTAANGDCCGSNTKVGDNRIALLPARDDGHQTPATNGKTCGLCGKVMHEKSLARHKKQMHPNSEKDVENNDNVVVITKGRYSSKLLNGQLNVEKITEQTIKFVGGKSECV